MFVKIESMEVDKLYRCTIGIEINEEKITFKKIIEFYEFEVIKRTQCGFWIIGFGGKKKFVLNYGNRRFAFPTKEEAEKNFVYRTYKRLKYLKNEVESVERTINDKLFKDLIKKHNLMIIKGGF